MLTLMIAIAAIILEVWIFAEALTLLKKDPRPVGRGSK